MIFQPRLVRDEIAVVVMEVGGARWTRSMERLGLFTAATLTERRVMVWFPAWVRTVGWKLFTSKIASWGL